MGEYSKSAIIKYNRQYLRITQEALAENICDVVTLARYESGKLKPSDKNFAQLMHKMGISGETYTIPMQYGSANKEQALKEIMNQLERYAFEDVENALNRLKAEINYSPQYPENRQCIQRIELILAFFRKKEISGEEYIKGLKEALLLTFKEYNETHFPIHRVFSDNEILIINNIATQYGESGHTELAFRLFENLEEYFRQDIVIKDYKPRYLVLLNYSCQLGLSGRYDESMQISKCAIQWLRKYHKSNYLYNFYYNIGWCIKKKIDEQKASQNLLSTAKAYVWMACQLCKIYHENPRNYVIMKNFYEKF